jgi:hypothetical protein
MFRLLRAQHDSAKKRYSKIPKLKTRNSHPETPNPKQKKTARFRTAFYLKIVIE